MLNLDEIDKTILDLENHDTTYAACEKLAWLYIVRDHLKNTMTNETILSPLSDDSEFLAAASNINISELLNILNEHMEVIKILHPREYASLIEKISALK